MGWGGRGGRHRALHWLKSLCAAASQAGGLQHPPDRPPQGGRPTTAQQQTQAPPHLEGLGIAGTLLLCLGGWPAGQDVEEPALEDGAIGARLRCNRCCGRAEQHVRKALALPCSPGRVERGFGRLSAVRMLSTATEEGQAQRRDTDVLLHTFPCT